MSLAQPLPFAAPPAARLTAQRIARAAVAALYDELALAPKPGLVVSVTNRPGAVHDMLLIKGLLDYMLPCDAPLATVEQLSRAHSASYVREIMGSTPVEGRRQVDPDTSMNPFTMPAALRGIPSATRASAVSAATDARVAERCMRVDSERRDERAVGVRMHHCDR